MEFWGVEVKAGQKLKVSPGDGKVIHLSQASIGESKKGKDESVPVFVKVDEQKLVIGTLSADKFPQIQYDVVFEKDFELSHSWKNGSVFFCGYKTEYPGDEHSGDEYNSDSEDEELTLENGGEPKAAPAAKPVAIEDAKVGSDEDDSDEDSEEDEDDASMDADDSDDEDEKTPTPKKDNKKRPTEAVTNSSVPTKKAKIATPQKTDGKKPAPVPHIATPHPAKQAGKNPKAENSKTPASASKVTCNSCSKTFNSDKALESHSKAKHASK